MRYLAGIIIAAILGMMVMSCHRRPGFVIPPDKMAELMADIHTGEAVVESSSDFRTDSTRQVLKQSILARHGVTTEQFDTSLYWYGQNIELFMEVNEKTMDILNHRIAEAQKIGNADAPRIARTLDGDSVDLWADASMVRVSQNSPSSVITFSLTADRNWERGDAFTLNLKPVRFRSGLMASMAVEYSDGTAEYISRRISGDIDNNELKSITLYLDSAKTATNVYGALTSSPLDREVGFIDSISLIRTHHSDNSLHRSADQNKIRYR